MSQGFDRVLVVDTGSVDRTINIVDQYGNLGVELISASWNESFSEARNTAVDIVAGGWVVFLDADEWFAPGAPGELMASLKEFSAMENIGRFALAPTIYDVDHDSWVDQVPRIFLVESGIRFRGQVHEYPVVGGECDAPIDLKSLDIEIRHDGYGRDVFSAKQKSVRNLTLLSAARANEPDNPRWLFFSVRDALPMLSAEQLIQACEELESLVEQDVQTGDYQTSQDYLRRTLGLACQGLGFHGTWDAVEHYCGRIEELDQGQSVDAQYFRVMFEVIGGTVTDHLIGTTIAMRRDEKLLIKSTLCSAGRHLDAAIAALVEYRKGEERAEQYRALCESWDDMFFAQSRLRIPRLMKH